MSTNINVDSGGERPLEGSSPMETKAEDVGDGEVKLRETGEIRNPFTLSLHFAMSLKTSGF